MGCKILQITFTYSLSMRRHMRIGSVKFVKELEKGAERN